MHVGIKLPSLGPLAESDALTATAERAEAGGFRSGWVSDHVVMPTRPRSRYPMSEDGSWPFPATQAFQDPLVALTWVAARTVTMQLGTGVLVLPLRDPLLLAKQVASLDVLSGGRVLLGVGTGWMAEEFALLGRDHASRGRRADAMIGDLRTCWGPDPFTLDGERSAHGALGMAPKPVRGAVPVIVGGHSAAARRRAVALGDAWYASGLPPDELARLVDALAEESERQGRTAPLPCGIRMPAVPPAEAADLADRYEAAGADFVVADVDYPALGRAGAVAAVDALTAALRPGDRDAQPVVPTLPTP